MSRVGRRVLVTGLSSFWGARVAQALEGDPAVEVVIGLDTREPEVALERTEFVRTDESYSILARIVAATEVDTILHTFLVVDSSAPEARRMHEINVIGTMNLFAAASAPGSTVRTVVVKSSTHTYGLHPENPAFFTEDTPRVAPPVNRVERSIVEVEQYCSDFAEERPDVAVSVLRYPNVLGPDIATPLAKALAMPLVPSIFGFDPLVAFVHEEDVVRSVLFAMERGLRGPYNVAGDGLLPWSEVAALAGKRLWPLPPVGTAAAARAMRLLGWPVLPTEALELLRYGRGLDASKLRRAGFRFDYDTQGAVGDFVAALRLRHGLGAAPSATYRYQADVESFFRHSPAIRR